MLSPRLVYLLNDFLLSILNTHISDVCIQLLLTQSIAVQYCLFWLLSGRIFMIMKFTKNETLTKLKYILKEHNKTRNPKKGIKKFMQEISTSII